jgi:hypothetical protein
LAELRKTYKLISGWNPSRPLIGLAGPWTGGGGIPSKYIRNIINDDVEI